jgi:hypothetical protein
MPKNFWDDNRSRGQEEPIDAREEDNAREDFVPSPPARETREPRAPEDGIGTAETGPAPPPAHVPTEGWLDAPQLILCWVNTVAGAVTEVRPAMEYTATVYDSGVGDPVVSLLNTGVPIAK